MRWLLRLSQNLILSRLSFALTILIKICIIILQCRELAEHVNLNETYLSKLFKKEMGRTVSEFIRDKKIEEACWLLRFTDKSSIEIATDLSFSSHSYFISVFKKVMTITPKEYRNRQFRSL